MNFLQISSILYSEFRIFYLKIVHSDSSISTIGHHQIYGANIEIGKDTAISIGNGLRMRKNSLIGVRDNAILNIGSNVFINRNTLILARKKIEIEDGVTIGPNVCIYDHDHNISHIGKCNISNNDYVCEDIHISRNVWIGAGSIILKGVTVGENSVIAAGSVVSKDVPANSILIQRRANDIRNCCDTK